MGRAFDEVLPILLAYSLYSGRFADNYLEELVEQIECKL